MSDKIESLAGFREKKRVEQARGKVGESVSMLKGVFADGYVDSGFDDEKRPRFTVAIESRDYRPTAEVADLFKELKRRRFSVERQMISRTYAAQVRREGTPDGEALGPYATSEVGFDVVQELFAGRGLSGFGAYQKSELGFRVSRASAWDERGVGFTIICSGWDPRRSRFEEHVIDDQKDMEDASFMVGRIRCTLSLAPVSPSIGHGRGRDGIWRR